MPKLADVRRGSGDCAGPPPGPRYRRHLEETEAPAQAPARPLWEPHPHVPADHLAFRNADGSTSRVCLCTCERCWPAGVAFPGPCPDWNDGSV